MTEKQKELSTIKFYLSDIKKRFESKAGWNYTFKEEFLNDLLEEIEEGLTEGNSEDACND